MFVSSNSFEALKKHFKEVLGDKFSDREIRVILLELARKRLNDDSLDTISVSDVRFSESDLLYFRGIRKRLLNNEPFQYILGSVEFSGIQLKTDNRALIPRPETEELVQWIIESEQEPTLVIDLCSGSGCIAFALKSHFSNGEVHAVELSDDAIELILENKASSEIEIQVVKEDVLLPQFLPDITPGSIDVIVSNPPYVLESDKREMNNNVLDFEPHMALFVSDSNPLLFYRSIASRAKDLLRKDGALYFEIHERFASETKDLLKELGFVNIEVRKDLQGKDRMIRAKV